MSGAFQSPSNRGITPATRRALGAGVLVVAISVPISLVLAVRTDRGVVLGSPRPAWVHPATPQDETSQVAVAVALSAPVKLVAPEWSGVVGWVIAEGQRVETGTPVAMLDGVARIAAHTSGPFFRHLAPGDSGSDVAQLNRLLKELHHSADGGDKYGPSTARGVEQLATALGTVGVFGFDPAWVVFLPSDGIEVASVSLEVGSPAPPAGQVVFEAARQAQRAWITPPPTDRSGPLQPQGDDSVAQVVDEETFPPAEVPVGAEVAVGDTPLVLAEDRVHVAEESLASLTTLAATGQPPVISATLRIAPPAGTLSVPANALLTDSQGNSCFRRRRSGQETTVAARYTTTPLGQLLIAEGLSPSDEVLVNSASTTTTRSCPTS